MANTFEGRVWKFGDDINTDLVDARIRDLHAPRGTGPALLLGPTRPGWVDEMKPGDVILAGRNFGVGSARSIGDVFLNLGISGVVAESFNGLGLRNCINVGLPSLPCEGILDAFEEGDVALVDWTTGEVRNTTQGTTLQGQPVPKVLQDIATAGGVEAMLRAEGYLASN